MAIEEISVLELQKRLDVGGVTLFDVREPDEYEDGHVPTAILVPLGDVLHRLDEFEQAGGQVIVVCKSGGRSMRAAMALAQNGIEAINVAGGTMGWIASGFDVVEGSDPE